MPRASLSEACLPHAVVCVQCGVCVCAVCDVYPTHTCVCPYIKNGGVQINAREINFNHFLIPIWADLNQLLAK